MSARRIAILFAIVAAGCTFESPPDSLPPPNADRQAGCAIDCHGDDSSNAPPKSTSEALETTAVAVGAHRAHLSVAPIWHRQIQCGDCHVVPEDVDSPGHRDDSDGRAEVTFAMTAGPAATWNGTTCTTRCHGSTTIGGAQPTPKWTQVDGSQVTCGSCHGAPPPTAAHTGNSSPCATCHPTLDVNGRSFLDPSRHVDGIIDWTEPSATGGCTSCHGSSTSSAPPKDLKGNTDHTARGVGAHAAHLKVSPWHREVQCVACHVAPTTRDAPGHLDGDNVAEVKFDALNPAAVYTAGTTTCSSLYCHGNGRGNNGTQLWVGAGPLPCTGCHRTDGTGMSGEHEAHVKDRRLGCVTCHSTVVNATLGIINANLHINGLHEVKMQQGTYNAGTRSCSQLGTGCHGARSWNGGGGRGPGGPGPGGLGGGGFGGGR